MKKKPSNAQVQWRKELATWLVLHRLTHKQASRAFAVSTPTISAWVSGHRIVPRRAVLMMRLYERLLDSGEELAGYIVLLNQTL